MPSCKKTLKRNKVDGDSIKAVLNEFRSLSYLIENDEDLVEKVYNHLVEDLNFIKASVPEEQGIPLLPKKMEQKKAKRTLEKPKKRDLLLRIYQI